MHQFTTFSPAKALRDLDAGVEKAVRPWRQAWPVRLVSSYGKIGDQPPLLALSGGVLFLGVVRRDRRLAGAGARMIAAHLLATGIKSFIKHRVDRNRPRDADGPADNEATPGHSHAKAKSSFPSGHSAGAMAVARAFGRAYPSSRPAATGAAIAVAASQISRSAHFATDALAGLVIGWSSEMLVNAAWTPAARRVSYRLGSARDRRTRQPAPRR